MARTSDEAKQVIQNLIDSESLPSMHRSRVAHFVIDVSTSIKASPSLALDAAEEPIPEISRHIYRRLRLPDSDIRVLLQKTNDIKTSKERMHLDWKSTT